MYLRFKRGVDLIAAILGSGLVLPIFLILLIYLSIRFLGSPFFVQERIGYLNAPFKIWKLRTFPRSYDESKGQKLARDLQFIRDLGLDEIPQLWSILMGQMSFVGPRPLLKEYLPLYSERQLIRHNCLPGILGLAQLKGGNSLTWRNRLKYDSFYAQNVSLGLDCKIIFGFLKNRRRPDAQIISERFLGNAT
jgi:lipopolysaccharide/colanic/teichoic acid biosynthesis glycosyltransferase